MIRTRTLGVALAAAADHAIGATMMRYSDHLVGIFISMVFNLRKTKILILYLLLIIDISFSGR